MSSFPSSWSIRISFGMSSSYDLLVVNSFTAWKYLFHFFKTIWKKNEYISLKLGVYQTFFLCFSCLNFYFIFSALDLCAEISGEILFFFPWSSQGKGQNSEVLPQPFSVYLRAYIRKPTEIVTLQSSLLYAHISDFTSPLCSSLGLCLPCIWYPLRHRL